jgi:hypothetical protein
LTPLLSLSSSNPHSFSFGLVKVLPCPTSSNISTRFLMHSLLITLMMEAVCISEMLVYFKGSTQHYIPEGCHLHTCCHEKLKSHLRWN